MSDWLLMRMILIDLILGIWWRLRWSRGRWGFLGITGFIEGRGLSSLAARKSQKKTNRGIVDARVSWGTAVLCPYNIVLESVHRFAVD